MLPCEHGVGSCHWHLRLGNGDEWVISGADAAGSELARHLSLAMQLQPFGEGRDSEPPPILHELWYFASAGRLFAQDFVDGVIYPLEPVRTHTPLEFQLVAGAQAIAQGTEATGSILLHGALAQQGGIGVLLAGPGNSGKTTASYRLPPTWRSLSDDATLVVRGEEGTFWGHPWPTWSRYMFGGRGGSWDVECSVPLRGIFFLNQSEMNHVQPVGAGHAVTQLVRASEQAWWWPPLLSPEKVRCQRLRRFDNICALASSVPAYTLHLSLTGEFWREIELALADRAST